MLYSTPLKRRIYRSLNAININTSTKDRQLCLFVCPLDYFDKNFGDEGHGPKNNPLDLVVIRITIHIQELLKDFIYY